MRPQITVFATPTLRVESVRNADGHHYVAWRPDTAQFFNDSKSLLKWASWPAKTPTGDALRAFLAASAFLSASAEEEPPSPAPAGDAALSPEDPNYATRTVI